MEELWLCGLYRSGGFPPNIAWEFIGIFDSKEKAIACCRSDQYFVASANLNEDIGDDSGYFPDCEYPGKQ